MSSTRFVEIELTYGCHDAARYEIPRRDTPVVIAGPNGSGKTSLIEGIVRTLYGFSRRQQSDRSRLDERRPWSGGGFRGRIVLDDASGRRWCVERQFDETSVEVTGIDPPGDHWSGDGNPGAENLESVAFRARLESMLGLSRLDHYQSTACVHQGALIETKLTDELLHVAVGGHAQLGAAKQQLVDGHRAITRQPIVAGERGGNKPRRLEELEAAIAEIEEALAEADRVERARGPLIESHGEATETAARLDTDIELLASALAPLGSRRAVALEIEELERRIASLDRLRDRLLRARERYVAAEAAWSAVDDGGPDDPDDLPERLAALGPLWTRRREVEQERRAASDLVERRGVPRWLAFAPALCAALTLVGLVLAATGFVWPGAIAALLGVIGATASGLSRARRRRELEDATARLAQLDQRRGAIDREVAAQLDGVPDAAALTASTAQARRDRFRTRRDARAALATEAAELERTIAATDSGADDCPGGGGEPMEAVAGRWLEWLERLLIESRNTMARKEHAAKQTDAALRLPAGVAAESDAVESALASRRSRQRETRARINEIERRIMETERIAGSPVALRDRLDACRREHADLAMRAEVLRAAYALLIDAYDEFRAHDQERLLDRVSGRVAALSGGRLGPVVATGELAQATLLMTGRPVAFGSPPLSFGEHHAALLGVRLGAADFLASGGVEPPLIVDDPFVHLDIDLVDQVWSLLCRLAADRQVIVATQDTLVLDHLGVQPDIRLARRDPATPQRPLLI